MIPYLFRWLNNHCSYQTINYFSKTFLMVINFIFSNEDKEFLPIICFSSLFKNIFSLPLADLLMRWYIINCNIRGMWLVAFACCFCLFPLCCNSISFEWNFLRFPIKKKKTISKPLFSCLSFFSWAVIPFFWNQIIVYKRNLSNFCNVWRMNSDFYLLSTHFFKYTFQQIFYLTLYLI